MRCFINGFLNYVRPNVELFVKGLKVVWSMIYVHRTGVLFLFIVLCYSYYIQNMTINDVYNKVKSSDCKHRDCEHIHEVTRILNILGKSRGPHYRHMIAEKPVRC